MTTKDALVAPRLFQYQDQVQGFKGYLAFDADEGRLAAGGLRVQPGLTGATVLALAKAMTRKQRLLGLAVDGAKAGIDLDPRAPRKDEALRRFLEFLRPHLLEHLSLGPDMGTNWSEIECIAREIGIRSVKGSIARAQGLDEEEFGRRLAILDMDVDGLTLSQRRSGHALAHAAIMAGEVARCRTGRLRVGIQGFGTLGRGTALSLHQAGAAITAVGDECGCILAPEGIDITALLATPQGTPVGDARRQRPAHLPQALCDTPLDVLVLAASEDALSSGQAAALPVRAVAVGANLGLAEPVETLLHGRGVPVVPDFVGGCGGSASMDALFGPSTCPTPRQVLDQTRLRMRELISTIFVRSQTLGITPRQAAWAMSGVRPPEGSRPYGGWARRTEPTPSQGLVGSAHHRR